MLDQIKLAIAAALMVISFGGGFYIEHLRYADYKNSVEALAEQQRIKVEEDKKNDSEITKSVVSNYKLRLSQLQQQSSSRGVFNIPKASSGVNGSSSYAALVIECQQTTIQLNSLQDWVNEQYKEDNK